jgi:cation transport ATPase
MKNIRLEIEGLEEEETRERVTGQLKSLIGVTSIELSDNRTYMDVGYDEHTSQTEICSHLQNNGYKIN